MKLPDALKLVVTFAFVTGWRVPSEVLPLQWPRIDRAAKTVRLEPGEAKNRKGGTFPCGLLPELAEVIETQWQEHERLLKIGTICPFAFNRAASRTVSPSFGRWSRAQGSRVTVQQALEDSILSSKSG